MKNIYIIIATVLCTIGAYSLITQASTSGGEQASSYGVGGADGNVVCSYSGQCYSDSGVKEGGLETTNKVEIITDPVGVSGIGGGYTSEEITQKQILNELILIRKDLEAQKLPCPKK